VSTAIKVCGLRRAADAERLVELARDYGGRVFAGCVVADDSPRAATDTEVRAVAACLRGHGIALVLVSRGGDVARWRDRALALGVERVQWHGATAADHRELERAGLRSHRVFSVAPDAERLPEFDAAPEVPVVLDVGRGGTGRQFAWSLLGPRGPAAALVAGGVRPDNLEALLAHRPWGIDLSSGVETSPGVKDHGALRDVFELLRTKGSQR